MRAGLWLCVACAALAPGVASAATAQSAGTHAGGGGLKLVGDARLFERVVVSLPSEELAHDLHFEFELRPAPLFAPGYAEQRVVSGHVLESTEPAAASSPCQHYRGSAEGGVADIALSVLSDASVTGLIVFAGGRQVHVENVLGEEHTVFRELSSESEGPSADPVDVIVQPEAPQMVQVGGRGDVERVEVEIQAFAVADGSLFVEVLAVNDAERLLAFDGNETAAAEATAAMFNRVALLFASANWGAVANVTVVLSGQIHWHENPFESEESPPDAVNNNGNATAPTYDPVELLSDVSEWRVANIESLLHHDGLFLISGKEFTGDTAGVAYLGAVCDDITACGVLDPGFCYSDMSLGCCLRSSSALSQLISGSPLTSTYIVAHELGHMLGFEHDTADGVTIMQAMAQTESSATPSFSAQSVATFDFYVGGEASGSGHHPYSCLANRPSNAGQTIDDGNATDSPTSAPNNETDTINAASALLAPASPAAIILAAALLL